MSEPENKYRKPNNCPYCDYYCDAAMMPEDEKQVPKEGDLTFCLMCCELSQFGKDMKLEKFDINSIDDYQFRNQLKSQKLHMEMFWSIEVRVSEESHKRRAQFLKNKMINENIK